MEIENFLLNDVTKEAVATYRRAQSLNKTQAISANLYNSLCWQGSLNGYVSEVMSACNQALVLQPKNGAYRDSRGVARALLGDVNGAIEDFNAFIDWTDDEMKRNNGESGLMLCASEETPFLKNFKGCGTSRKLLEE